MSLGTRRDDITSQQQAQIRIEGLASNRGRGTIVELAEPYVVSRKTVYDIAEKGKQVLHASMEPGPQQKEKLSKEVAGRLTAYYAILAEKLSVLGREAYPYPKTSTCTPAPLLHCSTAPLLNPPPAKLSEAVGQAQALKIEHLGQMW